MTKSNFTSRNASQDFERAALASNPYFSCNTRTARGLTRPVGLAPALNVSKRPLPLARKIYSPRIERAELPVHRIKTLKGSFFAMRKFWGIFLAQRIHRDSSRKKFPSAASAARDRAEILAVPVRNPAGRRDSPATHANVFWAEHKPSSCPRAAPRPTRAGADNRGVWKF